MHPRYYFLTVTFLPYGPLLLLGICVHFLLDERTLANYIYAVVIFGILISLYEIYDICPHKKHRAVPADVGGEPGPAFHVKEFRSPVRGITDIADLFHFACNHKCCKHTWHQPFLGTREVISREVEIGVGRVSLEKLHLGDYKWLTYKQVYEAVQDFANGLGNLNISRHQRVAILSDNRAEFFIAMHGCFKRGVVVVILDASFREDAFLQSLNETEAIAVVCGRKELKKLINIHGQLQFVKTCICMDDDIPYDDVSALHGWTIICMTDVKKLGNKYNKRIHIPRPKEDAVIMYTIGSTGFPKGVMMTHANIIATTIAVASILLHLAIDDVYLAYLPMANIHELVIEHAIVAIGGAIGYGSPLTDRTKMGTKDDVTSLMPTVMATIPAILDHVHDVVLKEVNAKGGVSKKLFNFAYKRRLQAVNGSWFGAWGLEKYLWNFLVFRKSQTIMGGRMRLILSIGAPVSQDTRSFINICLDAPILQGYGLTETCASGTFSDYDDITVGRVGLPLPFSYVKLINWLEGGYSTNDPLMPSGEIVIGGTSVSRGYFKNEEITKECFKVDERGVRWFYTGDIGRFNGNGCLEIIDKKNDKHGEHFSLEKDCAD